MQITQREKKKTKFRVSFIFLFIFASFAIGFTLYMKEDFEIPTDLPDDSTEAVVYIDGSAGAAAFVNPVPRSERADKSYYDDAVFIGSRTLSGLADYGYVKQENMLLSDSITLNNFNSLILAVDDEQGNIAETVQRKNAGKAYVMVGLYDLADAGSENFFGELEAFIDSMNAAGNAKIYLMSLLPVPADTENIIAKNTDIDAYNSMLLKFADRKRVCYLDVSPEFKGNDGKLSAAAAELNGIRLKEEYYEKLSDYILTHVSE